MLRRVRKGALQGAWEERVRLIKKLGFGDAGKVEDNNNGTGSRRNDELKETLHTNWMRKLRDSSSPAQNAQQLMDPSLFIKFADKKSNMTKIFARLVWILTLPVVGLECKGASAPQSDVPSPIDHHKQSTKDHNKKATKSLSKNLLDYVIRKFLGDRNDSVGKNMTLCNTVLSKTYKKINSLSPQSPLPQFRFFNMMGKVAMKGSNANQK